MAILKLNGDTSGYVILQAASVAQNNVLTLPNTTDTLLTSNGSVMNSATINGSTLNNPILAGSGVITGSLTGGTLANTTLSSPTITGSWSQQNLNLVGTSALVGNGVYIPAANTVGFITNTTERMRLTSGGNLLVNGTVTPLSGNATVVISGLGTNGGGLQLAGGLAGGTAQQSLNGGGLTWNTYTGAVGSETYAERMRLDSNGNLGVGVSTLSLGGRLTVGKASVPSFTGSASGVVTVSDTSSTLNSYTALDFTNTNQQLPLARIAMQFTSSGSYVSLGTTNSYGSGVNNTAMTIDPTGSVGIGTSSPITKLTVQTAALTDAIRWTDNITSTGILSTASGLSTMWTTTALGFGTGSGAYTERMRINSSGQVGINTTNPGGILQVNTSTQGVDGIIIIGPNTSSQNGQMTIRPNNGQGNNNGITQAGDSGISYSSNAGIGTGNLVIAPWFNGVSGIRMNGSGNVGIATTNATAALHVFGNATGTGQASPGAIISRFMDGLGRNSVTINGGIDGNTPATNATLNIGGGAALTWSLSTTHGVNLATTFAGSGSTGLVVQGYVGINDTSPGANLTVGNGTGSTSLFVYGNVTGSKNSYVRLTDTGGTSIGLAAVLGGVTKVNIEGGTGASYFNGGGNVGIGSTTPQQTLDVSGNVNVLNTVIMGSSFLRNRIINGSMQVAQYGTSVAPTVSNFTYSMDRFFCAINSGTSGYTVTQLSQANTGLSGFYNALRYQRNSGQTNTTTMAFGQTIETANCYDLAGQTVTLSFWARAGSNFSAASSQITARIATGTGVDQGSAGAYNGTWTGYAQTNTVVTISTSWVRYSIAVTIPAGVNEIQILFYWAGVGTAGTNDYADFTGIQFEAGPVATPFERRQYGQELSLCQRYYWINSSATNSVSYYMPVFAFSTTVAYGVIEFPVTMRTTPTISTTGTPANYRIFLGGTAYALTGGPDIDIATPYSSSIRFTTAGTLTVGQAGMAGANSSTAAFLGFNAEL